MERATKVQVPSYIVLQQSVCHLFPFECYTSDKQDEKLVSECAKVRNTDNIKKNQAKVERSK